MNTCNRFSLEMLKCSFKVFFSIEVHAPVRWIKIQVQEEVCGNCKLDLRLSQWTSLVIAKTKINSSKNLIGDSCDCESTSNVCDSFSAKKTISQMIICVVGWFWGGRAKKVWLSTKVLTFQGPSRPQPWPPLRSPSESDPSTKGKIKNIIFNSILLTKHTKDTFSFKKSETGIYFNFVTKKRFLFYLTTKIYSINAKISFTVKFCRLVLVIW